jgi:uncharacterized RDD family membrane protein YckC
MLGDRRMRLGDMIARTQVVRVVGSQRTFSLWGE